MAPALKLKLAICAAVITLVLAFGTGWAVQGWRMGAEYRPKPSVNMPLQQPKLLEKSQKRWQLNNELIKKHQLKLNAIGSGGEHLTEPGTYQLKPK